MEIRLESDNGLPPLDINPRNGLTPQSLNIGFPEVRDNTSKRPGQNGTFDRTQFTGSSTVQLIVAFSPEAMVTPLSETLLEDSLRRWMSPKLRSRLQYRRPGEEWREIGIRASNASRMFNFTKNDFGHLTLSWRAPRGLSESIETFQENLPFSSTESGRTYDRNYNRTYPASEIIGLTDVFNGGTEDSYPIIHIHGPATGVRAENVTTEKILWFKSDFELLDEEFLVINFEEGTVYMNGDADNSRYNQLDVTQFDHEWWTLIPGSNLIRVVADASAGPAAHGEIFWKNTYI